MMSLTHPHLFSLVKKQYQYKLKAFIGVFSSIVIVQLIAMLFSVNGGRGSGGGPGELYIDIDYFSYNTVIGFTMITILINAIHITTKTFKEDGFIFTANRLSANLSNIVFL